MNIGSTLGGLAGTALLGPLGGVAGAWLGSKVGGLFGKKAQDPSAPYRSQLVQQLNRQATAPAELSSSYVSAKGEVVGEARRQATADAAADAANGTGGGEASIARAADRGAASTSAVAAALRQAEARRERAGTTALELSERQLDRDEAARARRGGMLGGALQTIGGVASAYLTRDRLPDTEMKMKGK